ncbi:hypothetical protein [Streptomyces sp. KL116D]|uniref:hypothetical protein n=1 Tax=Streptomyces sp. KL116D TaxID=3045152 RepID=UPI00355603EF
MTADLGVGPGVLKQGAKDIEAILKPVKKVDLGDEAWQAPLDRERRRGRRAGGVLRHVGVGGRIPWPTARRRCRRGLDKANGDYEDTDTAIRNAVKSVKTVLV